MVEEVKDTIFVGGIPYDMTLEEFEEEVQIWGPVTKKYLKYHGGWGTVTFESNSSRNRFLKDKTRHKVGSKLVDVKPYIYNPEKVSFDDLFIGLFVTGAPEHMWTWGLVHTILWDKALKISHF